MVKDFEVSPGITLMFGMDAAIKIRQEGWKEIKKEGKILRLSDVYFMYENELKGPNNFNKNLEKVNKRRLDYYKRVMRRNRPVPQLVLQD